jgi:hypothetical protein
MTDRTLPNLFRLIIVGVAISQTVFGLTLLLNPSAIVDLWPWPMTSITTRILGASTLVSVPLAIFSAVVNRWTAAFIPIVMLLTYRVFQLIAGVIHFDRFDFAEPTTWNYFFGGTAMLLVLGYVLVRGGSLGQPVSDPPRFLPANFPLDLGAPFRIVLTFFAGVFILLGVLFLVLGPDAAPLWFEADGELTPLTARLFASPMIGLALALWLVSRAQRWHEVAIPACGMAMFGVTGTIAILIEWSHVAPPSPLGYFTASVAPLLLILGVILLIPGLRTRAAAQESAVASDASSKLQK